MKKSLAGALLVLSVIAVVAIARAQDKKEPEHKLIEFHMALLKRGPELQVRGNAERHAVGTYSQCHVPA